MNSSTAQSVGKKRVLAPKELMYEKSIQEFTVKSKMRMASVCSVRRMCLCFKYVKGQMGAFWLAGDAIKMPDYLKKIVIIESGMTPTMHLYISLRASSFFFLKSAFF